MSRYLHLGLLCVVPLVMVLDLDFDLGLVCCPTLAVGKLVAFVCRSLARTPQSVYLLADLVQLVDDPAG